MFLRATISVHTDHQNLPHWTPAINESYDNWLTSNNTYVFKALTCIGIATGYPDPVRLQTKTDLHTGLTLWQSMVVLIPSTSTLHSWSRQRIHRCRFPRHSSTRRNSRCPNHRLQSVGQRNLWTHASNSRKTTTHLNSCSSTANIVTIVELVAEAIATYLHSLWSTANTTLGVSPGALIFHRHMFPDIPISPDSEAIQATRTVIIDENLPRQNKNRRQFRYWANDKILLIEPSPKKIGGTHFWTFQHYFNTWTNGTVTMFRKPHMYTQPSTLVGFDHISGLHLPAASIPGHFLERGEHNIENHHNVRYGIDSLTLLQHSFRCHYATTTCVTIEYRCYNWIQLVQPLAHPFLFLCDTAPCNPNDSILKRGNSHSTEWLLHFPTSVIPWRGSLQDPRIPRRSSNWGS